jgi:lysozyme family protein
MSAANFNACLAIVLASEGSGFDPSGPSKYGILQSTLTAWLGRPASIADVQALTPETVSPIYESDYFALAGCRDLPAGLDLEVFDAAVQHGTGTAVRMLQRALGVTPDTVFGSVTADAAAKANIPQTINAIVAARAALYRSLAGWPVDGPGWTARLYRTATDALAMVGASQPASQQPAPDPAPSETPAPPPIPPASPAPVLAPIPATPAPKNTAISIASSATPAQIGTGVALAGLTAGATAMSGAHVASLKDAIDLAFTYLVAPIGLGVVAGLIASAAAWLHVNTQSAMAQRVITALENGASAALSQAQAAADAHSTVTTKSALIASAISYVNGALPDTVRKLGLATPQGQVVLQNLATAKVTQVAASLGVTPQ